MGRTASLDYVLTGRHHKLTVNGHKFALGETLPPSVWLGLGARKRRMFLERGIVELLPRCVGRPKLNGA